MTRFILAVLLAAVAQPADALSCRRPTVERSFAQAQAATDAYMVVLGQFDFDPKNFRPEGVVDRRSVSIPARIKGRALTSDGFSREVSGDVVLDVECLGSYCGRLEPGTEGIAFLRRDAEDWVMQLQPCPQWFFPNPSRAQRQVIAACLENGNCKLSQ